MNQVIDELNQRKLSLTEALSKRTEGIHDETCEWKNTPMDEMIGRLQEINNTLELIGKWW